MALFEPKPKNTDATQKPATPISASDPKKSKGIFVDTEDRMPNKKPIDSIDWDPKPEIDHEPLRDISIFSRLAKTIKGMIALTCGVIGAAFFIVVFSNTVSLLRDIQELPTWMQWISYSAVGALLLVVIFGAIRLGLVYFRFATSPNLSIESVTLLNRRNWSKQNEASEKAIVPLKEFLRCYPGQESNGRFLRSCGLTGKSGDPNSELSRLYKAIDRLEKDHLVSDRQWIEDFRNELLPLLDKAAESRINTTSLLVGAKTAISPRGLVDAIVIVGNTWFLIGDLCKIYGVRPSWYETGIIFAWTGFNTFVSYRADELADGLEGKINEAVKDEMMQGEITDTVFEGVTAAIVSKVAVRAAEGTMNAYLVRRLGKRLQNSLRPIKKESSS